MSYPVTVPHDGCKLLCKDCHAEAIEVVDRKEWFHYEDLAHNLETMLPVLHRVHRCTVCGHEEPDADTGKEHAAVIAAFRRPDAHYWTPFPTSYCQQCGTTNPLEWAIEKGYFDTEDQLWLDTEEGAASQWRVSRINIFGCHVKHPFTFH